MVFHVKIEHAEDGWIVVECPALPGCVSQGKDEKEALDNLPAYGRRNDSTGLTGLEPEDWLS